MTNDWEIWSPTKSSFLPLLLGLLLWKLHRLLPAPDGDTLIEKSRYPTGHPGTARLLGRHSEHNHCHH